MTPELSGLRNRCTTLRTPSPALKSRPQSVPTTSGQNSTGIRSAVFSSGHFSTGLTSRLESWTSGKGDSCDPRTPAPEHTVELVGADCRSGCRRDSAHRSRASLRWACRRDGTGGAADDRPSAVMEWLGRMIRAAIGYMRKRAACLRRSAHHVQSAGDICAEPGNGCGSGGANLATFPRGNGRRDCGGGSHPGRHYRVCSPARIRRHNGGCHGHQLGRICRNNSSGAGGRGLEQTSHASYAGRIGCRH